MALTKVTTDVVDITNISISLAADNTISGIKQYVDNHTTSFDNVALTGVPTVPTASPNTNSTQIASTAFVRSIVDTYTKSVAGGINITLTADEAANGIFRFTGALTANISIFWPAGPVRTFTVQNITSGAFTLTCKTAAGGAGVIVTQGTAWSLFGDGTNIIDGISDFKDIALTGIPTVPTAVASTNTTQVASTAFVHLVAGTNAAGARTISTAAPTGGVSGDIWYKI